MIAALGLDLSLAATGVARADGGLATIPTKGHEQGRRLHTIASMITPHLQTGPPKVIVVEKIAGPHPATNIKLAHVHGIVLLRLFEMGLDRITYLEVVSSELHKYATNSGRAQKWEMQETAENRASAQGLRLPKNDNEADAFWLRQIAIDAHDKAYRGALRHGDDRDLYRAQKLDKWFGAQP